MSEPVKITVRPNGPLRVEGPIVLSDAEGREWDLTGKPAVSLCRCGASEKRPFCDGSHNKIGFQCMASPAPSDLGLDSRDADGVTPDVQHLIGRCGHAVRRCERAGAWDGLVAGCVWRGGKRAS